MKSLDDISNFLRNALSETAYNYEAIDAELGFAAGAIHRILDATGDYSVMELMAVLDWFGLEIDIFDQKALQRMKEGPQGVAPELVVKTKVKIAVDRLGAVSGGDRRCMAVYYGGWGECWPLGTLEQDADENIYFEYSPQALEEKLELSPLKLPLSRNVYSGFPETQHRLPGLIADSLPDGWGMLLMEKLWMKQGIDAAKRSPLDRLSFVGHFTMGALTYFLSAVHRDTENDVGLRQIAEHAQEVMIGKDYEFLERLVSLGAAPHGARPKALVDYNVSTGAMGVHGVPNGVPWLVKFQSSGEHKEVCAIEHYYAGLARACGIDIPDTRYFDLSPELGAFGVARFDREDGMCVPIHTLAGATNADFRLPGAIDYQTFLEVTRNFTKDEREVEKAFARVVFNVVFNNRDDHPKNFSFRLSRERQWKLSPAYDLTFASGTGGYHHMDVMGEAKAITRKHMIELATGAGISTGKAQEHIDRHLVVAGRFGEVLKAADVRPATVREMAAQVNANAERLR
ncbi:type II toxin-antitoxin system HipA family toxin [Herbaspirillum rubrisubalbicans]|uniref:type II toxin-antitoxin system HipA family toxin n=1 Tax=Herbaspirillum rubrisubalbicans TaxID=80842 RepID=UPI000A98E812|nr:type II toxin-antitoxin system HipA family toxin [Herbaspirillum rubrisubalbicans]